MLIKKQDISTKATIQKQLCYTNEINKAIQVVIFYWYFSKNPTKIQILTMKQDTLLKTFCAKQ